MQIIDRACSILELLSGGEPLTVSEISEREKLPRPTTYRLLNSLTKCGFLEKDLKTKRYSLGWSLLRYVKNISDMTAQKYMIERIRPTIFEAAHDTEETITLAAFTGSKVVLIAIAEGVHSLRFSSEVGKEMPWNAAAPAKLFMALQKDAGLKTKLLQSMSFIRYTTDTICDLESYLAELSTIQQRGIAYCINELDQYCTAVSVPIFDSRGQIILALTAVGHSSRVNERLVHICQCLHKHAEEAGRILNENPLFL